MTVPDEDLIVIVDDVRRAGFCARGLRQWGAQYGWNLIDFIKHGKPAADILATGDALGERVVEAARERVNGR